MTFIVSNESERKILEIIIASGLSARLFKNDLTITEDTITTDFVEAEYSGYKSIPLSNTWTISTSNNITSATYENIRFIIDGTPESAQTVYGYYVTQGTANTVVWADRFDSPVSLVTDQDQVNFIPYVEVE